MVLPDESTSTEPEVLAELAQAAERLGYSTAWLPDHVLPPGEYSRRAFGGVYEPLVTIGWLAAATSRLRFGTSVLIAPLRNPFVLAKQVATLQELSLGRMVLGVGIGWSEPEFAAVGARFDRRGALTDDTLALLQHLWSGGSAPYEARRFGYEQGVFAPLPRTPVPIMVGGNSDAALRRAARTAQIWQGLPDTPAAYATRVNTLAGLNPDVVPAVRIDWDGTGPVGDAVEEIRSYAGAGARQVAVHFGDVTGTEARMAELIEAL